jgi:hypothetical protein
MSFTANPTGVTCDGVRRLVEEAGKVWAVVISGDGIDTGTTQFTSWGKSPEAKVYSGELLSWLSEELCPGAPTFQFESFKLDAAKNKCDLEAARERLAQLEQDNARLRHDLEAAQAWLQQHIDLDPSKRSA